MIHHITQHAENGNAFLLSCKAGSFPADTNGYLTLLVDTSKSSNGAIHDIKTHPY